MNTKLQPGPELDAIVAERIMVWKRKTRTDVLVYWKNPEDGNDWLTIRAFSKYIQFAWQVVERLIADGFKVHLDVTELGIAVYLRRALLRNTGNMNTE